MENKNDLANEIFNKYASKLKVIEKDVELTEDEKQKLYKNIQKKVTKLQTKYEKMGDTKRFLFDVSKTIAGDNGHNKLIGVASVCSIVTGIVGCFVCFSAPGLALASMTTLIGSGLAANSLVNKKDSKGTSIIEEKDKENEINCESLDKVFNGLKKQLNSLIKPKEVIMER